MSKYSRFCSRLHMPPDDPEKIIDPAAVPRAVRIFLHHSPPLTGEGEASFDELAVISWEEAIDLSGDGRISTPHAKDFLKIKGPEGSYRLELTFRRYRPALVPRQALAF